KWDLGSATSWAHHSRTGNQKAGLVVPTIPEQRKYPLTALESRRIIEDTLLFSRHFPKDPTKSTSRSGHKIQSDDIVDVCYTGRGLRLSDNKYSANGRFWFGNEGSGFKEEPKLYVGVEIPRIGLRPFN